MSMNMDGMDGDVADYSDFEYQTIEANPTLQGSDGPNVGFDAVYQFEPLEAIGGLDNNEVAELVYLEVHAGIEIEDESDDQNVATGAELRGVVGINLPESQAAFLSTTQSGAPANFDATVIRTNPDTEEPFTLGGANKAEDRFLQPYRATASPPFDDQTNGPGGGRSDDAFLAEKSYRDLTGRGPVLDANDDVSISLSLNVGDTILQTGADIRVHMVWDVAETSDAGRRFSVPQ